MREMLDNLLAMSDDWDKGLNIELRPYQKEALDSIDKAFGRTNSVLISVPTGGGKTLIFNTYVLKKGLRALMIAHRDELLAQAIDKYIMIGGKVGETGVIGGGEWRESRYTVASIQTLARDLGRIDGSRYDVVIWDEAHHVPARTYRATWERLRETNPGIKMLGVTATPFRHDGQNLAEFFDQMAYSIDILELIRLGYLVPVRGKLVRLPVNMDDIQLTVNEFGERDFSVKSVAKAFHTREVNDAIVQSWLEHGENRKTIFYLPSLAQAEELSRLFVARGVPSAFISGSMSMETRREILRRFKSGEIRVITNMNILTEGFDDPYVECIAVVRPTKSLPLYAQIVGRGFRIAPDKRDCLILDFVGISRKHTIVGLPELFGIDREAYEEAGGEVAIGAVRGGAGGEEPVVKVLLGSGADVSEFTFDGQEVAQYATRLGDIIVVSCGLNGKVLILEPLNQSGRILYSLSIVEKHGYRSEKRVLKAGLTEDYAWTVLTAIWKKEMDDFMVVYKDVASRQPLTDKQAKYITEAVLKGKLRLSDLPKKSVAQLNKLEATNILGYIFSSA